MEQPNLKNLLETRKIPIKQGEIRINFNDNMAAPEPTIQIQPPVKILDKRKNSVIDRQLILNRLNQRNVILVKTTVAAQTAEIIPTLNPTIITVKRKKIGIQKETLPTAAQEPQPEIEKLTEAPTQIELLTEREQSVIPIAAEPIPEVLIQQVPPPAAIAELPSEPQLPTITDEKAKKPRKKAATVPPPKEQNEPLDITKAVIRDQNVMDRLPKEKEKIIIKAPSYYMNNRRIFTQKIAGLFNPFRQDLITDKNPVSCDNQSQNSEFDLLTHQKIVRDYLNLYTPYRGLLLYHGLGSGKTCTSIAIAEGMKSERKVFVLTPASLKMNFFSEMKKCGDDIYRKNQFWEFVPTEGNPQYTRILSEALSIPTDFVEKHRGAWLVNVNKKTPTFTDLDTEEQNKIDEQINLMIRSKYTDINYNGLTNRIFNNLTENRSKNPFNNSVVVIDEAHNFVSRIVNNISKKDTISYTLYDYLMSAQNTRIVLLTGTPIINYPKEIAILFNILRGYIRTWTMTVNLKEGIAESATNKINTDIILQLFHDKQLKTYDFVEYKGNKLTITRNPFGFINVAKPGVVKGTQRAPKPAVKRGGKSKKNKKQGVRKTRRKTQMPYNTVIETAEETRDLQDEDRIEFNKENNDVENIANNPYKGGENAIFDKYNGVKYNEQGNVSDDDFIKTVVQILKQRFDVVSSSIELKYEKALPDGASKKETKDFTDTFVNAETAEMMNVNLFQRRILGLTSYFRSAQEDLLPRYVKTPEGDIYYVEKVVMSQHQFGIYAKIRKEEAELEKRNKNKARMTQDLEELLKVSSTYKIFSRAACNFVFPEGIDRPIPKPKKDDESINEMDFDVVPKNMRQIEDAYAGFGENENENARENNPLSDMQEVEEDEEQKSYAYRIEKAMRDVNVKEEDSNESVYLNRDSLMDISPKLLKVLENITDIENKGLHLLYSHFRTIEGIGIMRLILLANGYAEFKLHKVDGQWLMIEREEDAEKPRFVLYTGTETPEEKEIIRNVYNGAWDFVPTSISERLREQYENNFYGEAIKLIMITSSGAEGINLKNTRFVHIIEPYWHMVRTEQVVGRARRICSHQDLPEEERNVKVFLYVTTFSNEQKTDENNIELRIRDVSRIDKKTPITTDELLYEIASIKKKINNQFLNAVKETAIDCNVYSGLKTGKAAGDDENEKLVCYGFGKVETNNFSSYPSFDIDADTREGLDVKNVKLKAVKVTIGGIDYAFNQATNELYDYNSYVNAVQNGSEPRLIGKLVNQQGQYKIIY